MQMSRQLVSLGIQVNNIKEKVHLAMNIVQSFAHEYVFDNHNYIDYPEMKKIVCGIIVEMFEE